MSCFLRVVQPWEVEPQQRNPLILDSVYNKRNGMGREELHCIGTDPRGQHDFGRTEERMRALSGFPKTPRAIAGYARTLNWGWAIARLRSMRCLTHALHSDAAGRGTMTGGMGSLAQRPALRPVSTSYSGATPPLDGMGESS
jgi:hypothetical protein